MDKPLTSEELDVIERQVGSQPYSVVLRLTAQARRCLELEVEVELHKTAANSAIQHHVEAQSKLAAAREVIEFYALPESIWVRSAALAADKGYTARAFLERAKTRP